MQHYTPNSDRLRHRLTRSATVALTAWFALSGAGAFAENWPAKPVKIVVPYAPGGAVDVVTRKMAQKLTEQTGQTFFVENKAGATGTIGALQVAKADADGYTLMANDTTYSLLPHIFKKLPFDHGNDLVPVGAFVFAPMAVALLADWAMFDPTGPRLHRMEIDILPENKRSRAVARKVGATLEGVRRAYMYVNGQWRDHESYVLMTEDAPNGFTARLMTGNSPS